MRTTILLLFSLTILSIANSKMYASEIKDSIDINQNFLANNQHTKHLVIPEKNELNIFTTGKILNVVFSVKADATLTIMTLKGKVILSSEISNSVEKVDLSLLSSGNYIVLIEGNDFIETCKVLIE